MKNLKQELWQQLSTTLGEGAVILVAALAAVVLGGAIWLVFNYGLVGVGVLLLILITARLFRIL
jgi:hypothetical protein